MYNALTKAPRISTELEQIAIQRWREAKATYKESVKQGKVAYKDLVKLALKAIPKAARLIIVNKSKELKGAF